MEKYNGWKNYETWLVVVNLENDYNWYKRVTQEQREWTSLKQFKDDFDCYMTDDVNWSKVSARELKEWYNDLINVK